MCALCRIWRSCCRILNILQEIPHRIQEIKNSKQLLILFCASGNRSGQHKFSLLRKELNVMGSWLDVNFFTSTS
jgi:rhodanese-related sulfurtransferase